MSDIIIITIECVVMGICGFFAGLFGVRFFNRMPPKWLCDYGKEPSEELKDKSIQRIKTYPWKFVIAGFFTVAAVKLTLDGLQFAIPSMVLLWALLLMAIADKKYMIIPDQLALILVVAALGYIPVHSNWKTQVFGALLALGVMLIIGLLGKLIYKRASIGGGDLKVYCAIGLALGLKGFIVIFVMTTLISAVAFGIKIIRKKVKWGDVQPLVPYVFVSTAIYLLVLFPILRGVWVI